MLADGIKKEERWSEMDQTLLNVIYIKLSRHPDGSKSGENEKLIFEFFVTFEFLDIFVFFRNVLPLF